MKEQYAIIYSRCATVATLLQAIIDSPALTIIQCHNAKRLTSLCQQLHPSLVIIYGIAEILNGSDLIESLRPKSERRPTIYVISWQHSEQVILSLLESGINQYLTLPISMHRLRGKVWQHFNIYH